MSCVPSAILEVAQNLILPTGDEAPGEAFLRSAASRAYYAALHAASDVIPDALRPTEAEQREKDSHRRVQIAMEIWARGAYQGRSEAREMARDLPKLKRTRRQADYELSREFTPSTAEEAVKSAESIIESAQRAHRLSNPDN